MQRRLIRFMLPGVLTACLLGGLNAPGMAQQIAPEGTLTTMGHGEVDVKPDAMSVMVMVETTANRLETARQENNRKMQAVVSALKKLNIPNMKLETSGVSVFPIPEAYEAQRNRPPRIVGYRVSNGLNVRVTGASAETLGDAATRIMDTALDAGANNLHGLSFYLDDMSSAKVSALQEAVQDARRSAEAMAQAANVVITGVYSIEGTPQYGVRPYPVPMATMRMEAAETTQAIPVEVGETTVSSDVTVRYRIAR